MTTSLKTLKSIIFLTLACFLPLRDAFYSSRLFSSLPLLRSECDPDIFRGKQTLNTLSHPETSPRDTPGHQLQFSNEFPLSLRLPTRNATVAKGFLRNTDFLLNSLLEKSQITTIQPNSHYKLRFITIPLPPDSTGGRSVVPELEISFTFCESECRTVMLSDTARLLLQRNTRSPTFEVIQATNFNITLVGELQLDQSTPIPHLAGFVRYEIIGDKPSLLQYSPAFITDGIITFIQNAMKEFVKKEFSKKLLQAFKQYCVTSANR